MEQAKKWKYNYIDCLDLSNITWLTLTEEEYVQFIQRNYFDEELEEYVVDESQDVPFGLHYVCTFQNHTTKYILGVVLNRIQKLTIVAACMYDNEYYAFQGQTIPATYIITVETNKYLRNRGLYHELCNAISHSIDYERPVICSEESVQGKICHTFQTLKENLKENGFSYLFIHDNDLFKNKRQYQKILL